MNLNLKKFSLTLLATFTLSACGSGGGSGNNNPSPAQPPNQSASTPSTQTAPTAQTAPAVQTTPASKSTPSSQPASTATVAPVVPEDHRPPAQRERYNPTNAVISGMTFSWKRSGSPILGAPFPRQENATEINKIVVGDKVIDVIPALNHQTPDGQVYMISEGENAPLLKFTSGYENTRWGYVTDKEIDEIFLLSIGHNGTATMPKGTATYSGNAVHLYSEKEDGVLNKVVKGDVNLSVDFEKKTLSGKITPSKAQVFGKHTEIPLSAHISGNTFEGDEQVKVSGGFYGKNAEEVVGQYSLPAEYIGAFGAKKQ